MAQAPPRPLTFEEFAALGLDGAWELVNGTPEELVPFSTLHSWTGGRIFRELDPYLEEHDPEGYWGIELDIPTIPFFGRRPDFLYYSAADARTNINAETHRAVGPPTLAVEVLSEDD